MKNETLLLKNSSRISNLLGQSLLKPAGSSVKKKTLTLMITSLVDAFSILVIYLLFGPAITGESIDPQLGIKLPVAYQSQLSEQEAILVVKNNKYYLNKLEVKEEYLSDALKKYIQSGSDKTTINKNHLKNGRNSLVIVADNNYDVEKINPILIAASQAGLNQLKLAVEHLGE